MKERPATREEDAKAMVAEALKLRHYYSIELMKKYSLLKDQDDLNRFINALRKAGLPE